MFQNQMKIERERKKAENTKQSSVISLHISVFVSIWRLKVATPHSTFLSFFLLHRPFFFWYVSFRNIFSIFQCFAFWYNCLRPKLFKEKVRKGMVWFNDRMLAQYRKRSIVYHNSWRHESKSSGEYSERVFK